MSNKTNDEKLRILRERLDQIKQKDDNSSTEINSRKENINEYTSHDSESIKKSKKFRNLKSNTRSRFINLNMSKSMMKK